MKVDLERFLTELETLVNIDSGQGNPEGITAVGKFFADRFSSMGWLVEHYDLLPNTGECVVVKNREAVRYDVMLIGHIDTVFNAGEVAKRPFRRDDKNCYGVGVIDMKQGCLAMQHILEALPSYVNNALNIVAVFNPDEEIGSPYSRDIQRKYASKSDYVFVFEAGGGNGEVTIERKGQTSGSVTIHGRAGHAGYMFSGKSLSAVNEMLYWVNALNRFHSAELGTSVNIGVIQAGEKRNIVPETAHFEFDIRYERREISDQLRACVDNLHRHALSLGYRVDIGKLATTPALVPDDRTLAYVERMREVAERLGVPFGLKKRGGLSDANRLATYGPVCIDSLGPTGDFDHSDKEYLDISTIEPRLQFAYELLREMAEKKRG